MKKLYLIGIALMVLAGLFTSCNNRIEPEAPGTPVNPEESITDYRLIFDGGVDTGNETRAHWSDPRGKGNLIFNWDYKVSMGRYIILAKTRQLLRRTH